ncbi:hypothetical protein L873DRAFT_1789274 [Choiromyces venosus 120613-1]|uniref:Uncharacterized protein n=1 Tax=Choiromyces venosus 120613-1 TaxID=1336337 RepID=A0A3N4JPG0_9PEZI|nr:hypothetical protein L873DRAFT_1789274 [Choiromyces venosus 120613-1]
MPSSPPQSLYLLLTASAHSTNHNIISTIHKHHSSITITDCPITKYDLINHTPKSTTISPPDSDSIIIPPTVPNQPPIHQLIPNLSTSKVKKNRKKKKKKKKKPKSKKRKSLEKK